MPDLGRPGKILAVGALIGGSLAAALSPGLSLAAGSCVNSGGSGGCYSTIQAAVNAASPGDTITVAAGTYSENVLIGKAITLQGAGAATTTIKADASVAKEGVIIQGVTSGKTTISGFTIQNAALSGVLIQGSSHVTLQNNVVTGNDLNLKFDPNHPEDTSCAGAAPFEQDDCGEGIHLDGADNALLLNNTVQKNAGGILLTDETGGTHDNRIDGNTVQDNILDCGITLASHPSGIASQGPPPTFLPGHGIWHNQVVNNTSNGNGGAGVGLFASVPGTATYDNLIQGNTITNNGNGGVSMHSHAPGQNLNGNRIIGNTIGMNNIMGDPDVGDQVTTGIVIGSAVIPVAHTVIANNTITDNAVGIWLTNTTGTVLAGNKITAGTAIMELEASSLPQANGPVTLPTGNAATTATAASPSLTATSTGASASFTVMSNSAAPGRAQVLFGSGPGCSNLLQVATRDLGAGTTSHQVVVTGNDLPGTIGNIGITQGATYWYEVVTMTAGGIVVDNNGGACYSVTIPTSSLSGSSTTTASNS